MLIKLVAKVQESSLPPLLLKKNISFQDERLSLKEKLKSSRLTVFIFSIRKKNHLLKQVSIAGQWGMAWANFTFCGHLEPSQCSLSGSGWLPRGPTWPLASEFAQGPRGVRCMWMRAMTNLSLLIVGEADTLIKNSLWRKLVL